MTLKTVIIFFVPAYCCGVLLTNIVYWVVPFTESVSFDIAYMAAAFGFGILLKQILKIKLPKAINLMFALIAALLLLKGQSVLYLLTTNFYWGWSMIWLFGLIIGLLYDAGFKPGAIFSLFAGVISGYLLYDFEVFTFVLIATLLIYLWLLNNRLVIKLLFSLTILIITTISVDSKIPLSNRQKKFSDLVIFSDFTRENKIDVTTWKGNYWYYVNDQNRISSVDDYLYHEPMVHPAVTFHGKAKKVLILGGELGGTVKEVCKYKNLEEIVIVPKDYDLIEKVNSNQLFDELSGNTWNDLRINIVNNDLFDFLENSDQRFDVIISDLPDPNNLLHNQYYTTEFFALCAKNLNENGIFVTQAGSPYFATKAYYSIIKTMKQTGFNTIPFHNQILTMGEWGWVLGSKRNVNKEDLAVLEFSDLPVRWINQEAIRMMLSFGKITVDTTNTNINTIKEPVTYKYYTGGNWSF